MGVDKLKGGAIQQRAELGSLEEMSTSLKEEDRPWENAAQIGGQNACISVSISK